REGKVARRSRCPTATTPPVASNTAEAAALATRRARTRRRPVVIARSMLTSRGGTRRSPSAANRLSGSIGAPRQRRHGVTHQLAHAGQTPRGLALDRPRGAVEQVRHLVDGQVVEEP